MNKQKIYKIKYIKNLKNAKKNKIKKQKKQQMLNEYYKKEKDNEVYLNILYNKNYECNLKKPTTKEIELNNIYKNLKINDWFNPIKDINFVDVAQDGNCFFRSLSVLIYNNENNYKKIKYAVKNKIIELRNMKDKEFIGLCNSIEYVNNGKKINEILEFDPEKTNGQTSLLLE